MHLAGAFIDDITVKSGGTTLFTDDVESGDNGLGPDGGFKHSTGTETSEGDRYYLVENRAYVGYDATLETGPYQFSNGITKPDWVEHFQFQDGMLVWAVDEAYSDNNTIEHQGHGLALPVDARRELHLPTAPRRATAASRSTRPSACRPPTRWHCTRRSSWQGQEPDGFVARGDAPVGPRDPEVQRPGPQRLLRSTNPLGGVYVAGHGVAVTVTARRTAAP